MTIKIDYNEATTLIALCSVTVENMKEKKFSPCALYQSTLLDLENIEQKCKQSLRRLNNAQTSKKQTH